MKKTLGAPLLSDFQVVFFGKDSDDFLVLSIGFSCFETKGDAEETCDADWMMRPVAQPSPKR